MTQRKDRYPESSGPGDHHDAFGVRDVVPSYDVGAPALVPEYERLSFEEIHAPVLDLLPESTGCILDVGAGTGRDAASTWARAPDETPRGLRRTGTTWSRWNRPRGSVRPDRNAIDRPTSAG